MHIFSGIAMILVGKKAVSPFLDHFPDWSALLLFTELSLVGLSDGWKAPIETVGGSGRGWSGRGKFHLIGDDCSVVLAVIFRPTIKRTYFRLLVRQR